MISVQDQLSSFLTQAISNAVQKNKSLESSKNHPNGQQQNQATVINQHSKKKIITIKRSDMAIIQKKLDSHYNSLDSTTSQYDIALKRPAFTPSSSQPTLNLNHKSSSDSAKNPDMKKHLSSQQLIHNTPSSIVNTKSRYPLSDKQLFVQSLIKKYLIIKSSVPVPATNQQSSTHIQESESKPRQNQKNEIIRPQTISRQQARTTIETLNNQEKPSSAMPTDKLIATNIKLSQMSKEQSELQRESTPQEQFQLEEHFQNKQQSQRQWPPNQNYQISTKKSSLGFKSTKKSSQKCSQITIKKCQTSQFFIILNETIIEQIIRFLSLKDITKFATLSRQARKLVPVIISKIDYINSIEETTTKIFKNPKTYGIVNSFMAKQETILTMLQNHQYELQYLIENISLTHPNIHQILRILKAGVLVDSNFDDNKTNVVDYIKKVGVMKAFERLMQDYVSSFKLNIEVPPLTPGYFNNRLIIFVRHVASFLEYWKDCKLPVNIQLKYYSELRLQKIQSLFMQQKGIALQKYCKPITRFRSSSNIYGYLNKNILSAIIPFLNLADLCHLLRSSKGMRALVQRSLLDLLPSAERQQSTDLEKAGISKVKAQSIVYQLHFEWYYAISNGIIMSYELNNKIIKALQSAIGIMFLTKGKENAFFYNKNSFEVKKIFHQIKVPSPEKISQIVDFLEEFPTVNTLKKAMIKLNRKQDIDNGVYLYQYIRGLQMAYFIALDDDNKPLDLKIYSKVHFKNDCKVYWYKKLIGLEQDKLLILERPLKYYQQMIFKERTGCTLFS